MKKKNAAQWQDLEVLQRQNSTLEAQSRQFSFFFDLYFKHILILFCILYYLVAAMECDNSSDDGDEIQVKGEIRELEEFCEVSDSSDSDYSYPTSLHKNKKIKVQEPFDFNQN